MVSSIILVDLSALQQKSARIDTNSVEALKDPDVVAPRVSCGRRKQINDGSG